MAVYNEEQAEELKAFGLNMVDISLFGDEVKTFAIGFTDSDYVAPELQGIVAMDKLERGFSDAKSERARLTTACAKCYVNPATEGILCFDCCGIEDEIKR